VTTDGVGAWTSVEPVPPELCSRGAEAIVVVVVAAAAGGCEVPLLVTDGCEEVVMPDVVGDVAVDVARGGVVGVVVFGDEGGGASAGRFDGVDVPGSDDEVVSDGDVVVSDGDVLDDVVVGVVVAAVVLVDVASGATTAGTSGNDGGGTFGGTVASGSRLSTFTVSCCHWLTRSCLR
jgi:hypothetical protein